MNKRLEKFARDTLREDLAFIGLHNMGYLRTFKLMYSTVKIIDDESVDEIIDKMPAVQLDWAMTQIENTLAKINKA